MTSWRTTNRSTVCALAVALAALFLAPSCQGDDARSAPAVHARHVHEAAPAEVVDADPLSDQRAMCADLSTAEAAPGMRRPALTLAGRAPACPGMPSRSRLGVRTCSLRGPPPA